MAEKKEIKDILHLLHALLLQWNLHETHACRAVASSFFSARFHGREVFSFFHSCLKMFPYYLHIHPCLVFCTLCMQVRVMVGTLILVLNGNCCQAGKLKNSDRWKTQHSSCRPTPYHLTLSQTMKARSYCSGFTWFPSPVRVITIQGIGQRGIRRVGTRCSFSKIITFWLT